MRHRQLRADTFFLIKKSCVSESKIRMAEEVSGNDPVDSERLLEHLTQIEGAAEDILADKQKLVDLDRHRNQTREAMRILQKDKTNNKQWMCLGNMFVKMEKKSASRFLEKDFDHTAQEIARTTAELKPKVNHLRDLEHKEELKGFNLSPLTQQEIASINDLL